MNRIVKNRLKMFQIFDTYSIFFLSILIFRDHERENKAGNVTQYQANPKYLCPF
jgi:hypothetical protein